MLISPLTKGLGSNKRRNHFGHPDRVVVQKAGHCTRAKLLASARRSGRVRRPAQRPTHRSASNRDMINVQYVDAVRERVLADDPDRVAPSARSRGRVGVDRHREVGSVRLHEVGRGCYRGRNVIDVAVRRVVVGVKVCSNVKRKVDCTSGPWLGGEKGWRKLAECTKAVHEATSNVAPCELDVLSLGKTSRGDDCEECELVGHDRREARALRVGAAGRKSGLRVERA